MPPGIHPKQHLHHIWLGLTEKWVRGLACSVIAPLTFVSRCNLFWFTKGGRRLHLILVCIMTIYIFTLRWAFLMGGTRRQTVNKHDYVLERGLQMKLDVAIVVRPVVGWFILSSGTWVLPFHSLLFLLPFFFFVGDWENLWSAGFHQQQLLPSPFKTAK